MRGRTRLSVILAATALAAAATPGSAGAAVDPGDILVADEAAGPGSTGAVIAVDSTTGAQEVISDNTINTGTDLLLDPRGIALDGSGNILVADISSGPGNTGAVISVNPTTGQQTVVSDNTVNTGTDLFADPIGIAVESDGSILVVDVDADPLGAVIRVNPATGQQTLVSNNDINTGTDLFSLPVGIAVESNGQILVSDLDSLTPHFGGGAIVRVDPATGQQTVVSSNTVNTGTDLFSDPWGVTLNATGEIIVTDPDSSTGNAGAVIGVDGTGQQAVISDNTINTGTDLFDSPQRSRVDAAGNIIVADSSCCGSSAGGVISVNPMTGQQVAVSTGGNFSNPFDLAVVPGGFVPPPGGGGGGSPGVTPTPVTPTAAPPAPAAKKCKKGQKLKKGKCVKKRRKK